MIKATGPRAVLATDWRRLGKTLRRAMAALGEDCREAANEALETATQEAIDIARTEDLVFRHQYIDSFKVIYDRSTGTGGGTLKNTAPHAEVIEYGGEYPGPYPPYYRIREWVEEKLGLSGNRAHLVTRTLQRKFKDEGWHLDEPYAVMRQAGEAASDMLEARFAALGSAANMVRRLIRLG